MREELKVIDVVRNVLKNDRRARKEPNWCVWKVLKQYGVHLSFQEFLRVPKFESILKCRREIMNKRNEFPEEFFEEEGVSYKNPYFAAEPSPKIKVNLIDRPRGFNKVVIR